ncbi:MAG: DinB family protein [Planctomycetes bacterium]|nr:DinB family protein [Planctomycetota bacterium]
MATARKGGSGGGIVAVLLDQLDRAYRGRSWHGTSLRGTLRGLAPATALWRPAPGRCSVWDYLLHAAYWKYVVRKKLLPDTPKFPRPGSNFPKLPAAPDAKALAADVALLDEQHALLRAAVAGLEDRELAAPRGEWRLVDLVTGAAAHDLYHSGQINLVKRLAEAAMDTR